MLAVFLVVVVAPRGLAGLIGWPWWSCLVGLVAAAVTALIGWKAWGWLQLRRADHALTREEEETSVVHLITQLDAPTQPRTQATQEYAPEPQDLDELLNPKEVLTWPRA